MNYQVELNETDRVSGLPTSEPRDWMQDIEQHPDWALLSRLPRRLAAGVPVAKFRMADLLALAAGQVIETAWPVTQDVALKIGTVPLCWSEFEVVEQRLAVRVTRLA